MANPIKRLNYFDHQFLRAQDFSDEQTYHLSMRRLHNKLFHLWGIASGLQVTFKPGTSVATIAAGMALDAAGNEIVLTDVAATPDVSSMKGQTVYVTVTYREQPSDPSADAGGSGNTRITETGFVEAVAAPADPSLNLVLAQLVIGSDGNITSSNDGTDPLARRIAGASGADVIAHSLTLTDPSNPVPTWPKLSVTSQSTAQLTGSLAVSGRLSCGPFSCQNVNIGGSVTATGSFNSGGPMNCGSTLNTGDLANLNHGANVTGALTVAGIVQQRRLYLSGGASNAPINPTWSSISYNAHHDGNTAWTFPDASRPAVTIEMDDNSGVPRFEIYSTTTASKSAWQQRFAVNGNTGDVVMCAAGGNLFVHGAVVNPSDVRLKNNVETIEDPLAKISAIRGVTYHLTNQPERGREIGVIAQDVEQVLPELVVTSGSDGMKAVDYSKLTAVLVEAIKQLKQEVDQLKNAMPKSVLQS